MTRWSLLPRDSADWVFGIQIVGGLGLIVPMMVRNWTNVEGVSLSFFLVLLAFCSLQMSLAYPAYQAHPSRKARQACLVYGMWIGLISLHTLEILLRGMYVWDTNDTVTILVTAVAATIVFVYRRTQGYSLDEPITKSQVAMTTRGIPQLLQGAKIVIAGGAGIPAISVLVGNLNIWIRIYHLWLTKGEAAHEQNRYWMLMSEVVNAATWGIVSLIWLAWRIGLL